MSVSPRVDAVVKAVQAIKDFAPDAYLGGWRNEIGTALVDAIFSIRAKYNATDPAKGVSGRVRTFRDTYPETQNDLSALSDLGEESIRKIMGDTRTASRPKAVCVIEAAQALGDLDPPIITADDALKAGRTKIDRAYTSVHGLGPVTAEYFQMHLGIQGVKADSRIISFVNRALLEAGLEKVSGPEEARDLVIAAYEIDPRGAKSLNAYEHAIWRFESNRGLTEGDDE